MSARPTALRLRLRDLSAGSAFGCMAVSGQVPLPVTALFVIGVGLGLLGRRLLARGAAASAGLLAVVGVALYAASAVGALDFVVAMCSFAALLTLHRVLAAPSPTTDHQVHLTSLLMAAGGGALSGDLLYAPCLAAFAVFVTLSMTLGVMEPLVPEAEPFPLPRVLKLAGAGAAAAVLGSVVFFFLFPRVSWSVASHRLGRGAGTPVAGLSDRVSLGQTGGTIKTSPRVVFRSELQPDPGTDSLKRYWIARSYDLFDGREWKNGPRRRTEKLMVRLREDSRNMLSQRIELLPTYGSKTLVALEEPVYFFDAKMVLPSSHPPTRLVVSEDREVVFARNANAYVYNAASSPTSLPWVDPGTDLADRLLQLPSGLDPRVGELARKIVAGEVDRGRAASRLERYLRANYRYSLDLAEVASDPLADFLFGRREGHCEYFATAHTIMLRTVGIPARLAVGFWGGERVSRHYIVRAGDAHAWTQVLATDGSFVTFDATPEEYRGAQAPTLVSWWLRLYYGIEDLWRTQVLDYTFTDQMAVAMRLIPLRRSASFPHLPPLRAWLAGLAIALVVWGAWRKLPKVVLGDREQEATRLRRAIDRILARARIETEVSTGLEEITRELAAASHPLAAPLATATRRYLEARFGGRPLRINERRQLTRQLALALEGRAPKPSL